VCRYTTLCPAVKAPRRDVLPSMPRPAFLNSLLTCTFYVNMFSVAVYYQTSVQDASATAGPCSRTARRHTLPWTHWRTCGVRTSRSSSLTLWPPNSPDLNPVDYAVWGALEQMVYQRRRFTTTNQLKQAIVSEWDKLSQRFIDRTIGQWRRRLECVVQQQGGHIEHLM